jgi:hypothetical protein
MFIILVAAAASFVLLPAAYTNTAPWVTDHILTGYGEEHLQDILIAWKMLLALLIFALTRAVLRLAFSAGSLALAMRLVSIVRDR